MSGAAWHVEALKLRRSPVARTSGLVLAAGTVAVAAAFTVVALGDGDSLMAAKVRPMLQGTGWEAYLGMLGQILSVAQLLCAGIVLSWSVGREFTDGTVSGLLAVATPRRDLIVAKLAVVVIGAVGAASAAVVLAIALGPAMGLGAPDGVAVAAAARVLAIGATTALLALPLAFVASVRRGYLPAIGGLLGLVVATQVATVAGVGAWFPWAAPSLWAGMGGAAAAATVTPVQLLTAVPVGAVGAAATAWWWTRAELV